LGIQPGNRINRKEGASHSLLHYAKLKADSVINEKIGILKY